MCNDPTAGFVDAVRTLEVARASTLAGYIGRQCTATVQGLAEPLVVRRSAIRGLPRIDGLFRVERGAGGLFVVDAGSEPIGRIERPPGIVSPPGMLLADANGHEIGRVVKQTTTSCEAVLGIFTWRPMWSFEVYCGDVKVGGITVVARPGPMLTRGYAAFEGTLGLDRNAMRWLDGRLALVALLLLVNGPGDWRGAGVRATRAPTRRSRAPQP